MTMIETLLKKLEPLLPRKTKHWRRTLDLVEPNLRLLVEKEILHTAHRRLGDFRSKLLLSLPPMEKSKGSIHLGTVHYDKPWHPFGISKAELLQNMAIFGRSGAGKTNVAFHILNQLIQQKIPFLFLDWKRTARHLRANTKIYTPGRRLSPFPFNPFIPPVGLEPNVYANHVVDVLGDAYTLGDAARSLLYKTLRSCYDEGLHPDVEEMLKRVDQIPDKERVRGWKISAIRALESLSAIDLSTKQASQEAMIRTLTLGNSVVELDSLSPSNKKFLIPILCLWIYYTRLPMNNRETLSLVIFVEEAHHVLYQKTGRESLMDMLLRQCREIGIGIIVIDQHPHLISSSALGNTYTSICMNLKDPKDINKAASLSLIEEEKRHLSMLPTGYGVVKLQDRWRKPTLIQFPLTQVKKGLITDEILARNGPLSTHSKRVLSPKNERGPDRQPLPGDPVLRDEELRFIEDVLTYQDDGVDKRYKRLRVSVDKGNKTKKTLLEKGVLEDQLIQIKRTRKMILRVTNQAKKRLGLEAKGKESLAHEYWKRWHARKLENQGYRVRIEAPRHVGRVDILATRASESLAIEVETGMSDVVWNVKQNLLSGFQKIIIVTTNENARARIERQLAEAGLIMKRIKILLRDGN